MQIDAANLSFSSTHRSSVRDEQHTQLDAWTGNRPVIHRDSQWVSTSSSTQVNISQAARASLQWEVTGGPATRGAPTTDTPPGVDGEGGTGDPVMDMLKSMIEMITGQPIDVFSAADLPSLPGGAPAWRSPAPPAVSGGTGFGMRYDAYTLHEEQESLDFSAEGVVHTTDGQTVRFTLDLQFERHLRTERQVSVQVGTPRKDPLVLNFGGTADLLTDRLFRFDLDGDGRADLLPGLSAGVALLVFDRNGNGRIDDANELFGPRSDDGFAELARLDDDGNGWVDGGDAAFARLGVWRPGEMLHSLSEAGVGALALAHRATPFELRDAAGKQPLGAIADSGVFLDSASRAHAMHDLDLALRPT